jgi:hypothetical protein
MLSLGAAHMVEEDTQNNLMTWGCGFGRFGGSNPLAPAKSRRQMGRSEVRILGGAPSPGSGHAGLEAQDLSGARSAS